MEPNAARYADSMDTRVKRSPPLFGLFCLGVALTAAYVAYLVLT